MCLKWPLEYDAVPMFRPLMGATLPEIILWTSAPLWRMYFLQKSVITEYDLSWLHRYTDHSSRPTRFRYWVVPPFRDQAHFKSLTKWIFPPWYDTAPSEYPFTSALAEAAVEKENRAATRTSVVCEIIVQMLEVGVAVDDENSELELQWFCLERLWRELSEQAYCTFQSFFYVDLFLSFDLIQPRFPFTTLHNLEITTFPKTIVTGHISFHSILYGDGGPLAVAVGRESCYGDTQSGLCSSGYSRACSESKGPN